MQIPFREMIAAKPSYTPDTPLGVKLLDRVNYVPVTALELHRKVEQELRLNHRRPDDDERCPICFCDLFDDGLLKKDVAEIAKHDGTKLDHVVLMGKCTDHCFHKECLESQMAQADYLKCAVCSITYGVRTGDQPPGSMTYKLEPFNCAGYPKTKTWTVLY